MNRDGRTICGTAVLMSIASLLLIAAGCQQPQSEPIVRFEPPPPPVEPEPLPPRALVVESRIRPVEMVAGHSINSRPVQCQVFGDGNDVVLIIASIHGNEQAGRPLLTKLSEYLIEHPEYIDGRRIVLVPNANPDGMADNKRHNLRGVDLNRNFPAYNFDSGHRHGTSALSEPESRVLYDLIQRYKPNRIITLHQPLNCIDYDGPGLELATAMAAQCDLPVRKLGSRDGSLGSYAGLNLNTPVITVEFARAADRLSSNRLWEKYGRMLLTAIHGPESYQEKFHNEYNAK